MKSRTDVIYFKNAFLLPEKDLGSFIFIIYFTCFIV
jgi:hypothetical protein